MRFPWRRLIDRIVRTNCHMVICTRAKPVLQDFKTGKNARKTKTRRADVPWDVAGDGDLLFEMTAMMMLDPAAPGCPVHQIKCADQFRALFDPRRPMGVETGRAMAAWAKGQGDAQAQKQLLDDARAAARQGRDAFTAFWNSDRGKEHRALLRSILDECQSLAREADAEARTDDTDPFGLPPLPEDHALSDADRERIAAEVRAETDRLAREAAGP